MNTCFLKFSEESTYLLDLAKKGHVYINNVEHFKKHEENGYKYDRHELASSYHQHIGAHVTIADRKFKIAEPFSIRHGDDLNFTHIYCLYSLSDESINKNVNNRIFDKRLWDDFGNYLLLIHNVEVFLDRLLSEFKERGFGYSASHVEYFCPNTYDGPVGPFRKRNIYDYQCEYRIAINAPVDGPITDLYIGDLTDICSTPMHKSKSINNVVGTMANL